MKMTGLWHGIKALDRISYVHARQSSKHSMIGMWNSFFFFI